jgi:hypothetical protein
MTFILTEIEDFILTEPGDFLLLEAADAPVYTWLFEDPTGATAVRDIDKFQLLVGFSLEPLGGINVDYLRRYLDDVL